MAEPPSIDEPLVLLADAEEALEACEVTAAAAEADEEIARLREQLAEARAEAKRDRAALEVADEALEAVERERDELSEEGRRLEEENRRLREQLEDHHGIMAADWAQTLGFQERLRNEESARERIAAEASELREMALSRSAEITELRPDAERWLLLTRPSAMVMASSEDLDAVLDVAAPALERLHGELHMRSRMARMQLHSELEQQLCVVCRDNRKAVLFLPCAHICVCEGCRGKLRPYRCPMCQEPVQSFVGRVHF